MKFYIDFKQVISTARVIEADTAEEAVAIAKEMIRDDDYWCQITEDMENDPMNWLPKECDVWSFGEADPDDEADNK